MVASPLQEHSNRSCRLPLAQPRILSIELARRRRSDPQPRLQRPLPSPPGLSEAGSRGSPPPPPGDSHREDNSVLPLRELPLGSRSPLPPPRRPLGGDSPQHPASSGPLPAPCSVNMAAAAALPVRRLDPPPTAAAKRRHPNVNGDSPAWGEGGGIEGRGGCGGPRGGWWDRGGGAGLGRLLKSSKSPW